MPRPRQLKGNVKIFDNHGILYTPFSAESCFLDTAIGMLTVSLDGCDRLLSRQSLSG
ncbi:MAG: hypothetical protein AAF974_11400 [Cyanobacteria bacterium P01_E01_bin.34]